MSMIRLLMMRGTDYVSNSDRPNTTMKAVTDKTGTQQLLVRYLAEHGQQLLHDGGALARVALEGHAQHAQGGAVQGAQ